MNFDLRLPIGLLFSIFGLILGAFGLVSNPEIYQRSLGINVNLWWGGFMFLFGILMLILWRRGAK